MDLRIGSSLAPGPADSDSGRLLLRIFFDHTSWNAQRVRVDLPPIIIHRRIPERALQNTARQSRTGTSYFKMAFKIAM
jgi:hypothetical protein